MATRSKEFMEFDVDWDERTLSEGRYGTIQYSTMCTKFGFGYRVFVRRGTITKLSANIEVENNMEVAKAEIDEVADPIPVCGPSYLDAPPKHELMYILVIKL